MQRSRSPIAIFRGFALLTAVSLGVPVVSLGEPPSEPPGRIYSHLPSSEHADPIWVSANELLGSKGQLDWQPLGEHAAKKWKRTEPYLGRWSHLAEGVQEVPEEACTVSEVSSWPHPPEDDFLSLLSKARVALVGTVIESTPGFLLGSPATLLTLEIDESWRLPASFTSHHLLVAYPQARFAVKGRVFCGRHQEGAVAPEPGQTLVVLGQGLPLDRDGHLIRASLQELVVVTDGKTLSLPSNLSRDDEMVGITILDQLLSKIRLGFERLEAGAHQAGR